MRFVVTKYPLGEVEVSLPFETRQRLKSIRNWAITIAATSVFVVSVTKKKPSPEEPSE